MTENNRIAIFISFSGQGGVEHMVNNLAQGFLDAGIRVDMVIARAHGDHFDFIPEEVNQIVLGTKHTWSALPGLVSYLRKSDPAALLAIKDRAIRVAVLARWISGKKVRLVGRIGTTVSAALEDKSPIRKWAWRTGMRLFYKYTDQIVAVSRGVAEDIRTITGLAESMIPIVPNPVITQRIFTLAKEPLDHEWFKDPDIKVIIGIGRLTDQKDFQTLIKAFAEVRKLVNCRLIILGEGGQRPKMESLVQDLGLTGEVQLHGFAANPYQWLTRSSLFVLSSRWEGSPNALTEALALGIPVVSTDCRSGPREILQDGRYGSLVRMGEDKELAKAMIRTLEDPLPVETLREAVRHFTVQESVKGYLKTLGLNEQKG
jgi:glycosyltransferase involved in cell wall biosynthesis